MNRVYNFSAGPSMLPLSVLERAASELVCYGESGMSVMEMSHRSPDYEAIIKDAEAKLRELMNIPDNYKVLFLQGGASTQFAAVPMNLIKRTGKADYVVSGQFSGKAFKEAQKLGYDVKCIATSKEDNFALTRHTCTFASTIPFTEPSLPASPTRVTCRWLPICPLVSFLSRLTFLSSA